MALASEVKRGQVVRRDGRLFKVAAWNLHAGGGKSGSMVHAKLRDMESGSVEEPRFEPKDEIEVLDVERRKMQYLYEKGGKYTFMDLETYDQVEVTAAVVGPLARFLKEEEEVEIELFEERPISLHHGPMVELTVTTTGAAMKDVSTYKDAVLENGMEIQVPQFVKEGDRLHIDIETGEYHDRIKSSGY
ncbi:MAG: elongation factor P [Elusimicrobia bacterium]|nr:MAG: elongation factor P [Elusimicrobiota bacterium]